MRTQEPLLYAIAQYINKHALIKENDIIIVGLSGGPDSIFLLHSLIHLYKGTSVTFIVAHLDHQWRPESTQDVLLCQQIAQQYNLLFVTKKISELHVSIKYNGSKEAYARTMRRHFFQTVAQEHQAQAIALAHHQQDQQETFLIRLTRGSSLAGLASMRPKMGIYIRPLLEISKKEIINFLDSHAIPYISDATNSSTAFLRNRIRTHALTALEQCDSRFSHNLQNTVAHLQETEHFLQTITTQTLTLISYFKNRVRIINKSDFLQLHPVMQQRILLHMLCELQLPFTPTKQFFNEIIRFLQQKNDAEHQLNKSWKIIKQKETFFMKTI